MEIGIRQPGAAREMGFDRFAEWAAEAGFKAIDVPRLTAEVKQSLDANGLVVGTVDTPAMDVLVAPDEDRRRAALAECREALTESAANGAKIAFGVLMPQDKSTPRAKSFEAFKACCGPFCELLAELDMEFVIEAWPGPGPVLPNLGCTPETLRAMFAVCDSERLCLCYDPSHLLRLGIDHIRFLWEFGDKVRHVHGKDTEILEEWLYACGNIGPSFGGKYRYGESQWRYTIPGEGDLDWTEIRNRLRDVGYTGKVCVELEDHNYGPSVEGQQEGMVNALRFLESIFD